MKKRIVKACALFFAGVMLASCCTVAIPVAATSNPVGTKCGETTSYVILGAFGAKGNETGIQQSAQKAGIKNISHVDSYVKNIFFGLVQKRTVKVYGE
ncbi:MAG: hypothetical protein IKV07_00600 [Bacteroidaceae bacterium]|nr:hypothetical protein [Bacteroidaceae bacterium]